MAQKGETYIMSDKQKRAISEARRGYVPTKEHRYRISQALKGHEVTKETRLFISEGQRRRYRNAKN